MPFAYYERLSAARQRTYRRSDEITAVALPDAASLGPLVALLEAALASGDRRATERAGQRLLSRLLERLHASAAVLRVYAVRPSRSWGELHGLYEPGEAGEPPRISLWMRTARRRQVVAFKTFLRTLLHELCHHHDYEVLKLRESFHTEGFFKRESSLFHQLVPAPSGDET